jgi:hypothetical protein
VFAALYADPDRLRGFLAAMSGASLGAAQAIAAKFPWQDYKSFVDIGTAQGMLAVTIARGHNHLSGADDERRQNAFGLLMSLNMLIETTGGFDFTGADCQAWMREAGFSQTRVEPLTGPDSMVIAIK